LQLRQEIFSSLSVPTTATLLAILAAPVPLIQAISDEWIELHGDRRSSDDLALVGGVARLLGDQ